MRIGLISAAYPPDLDGIGDYTWWTAQTLAEREDIEKPVYVFTRIGSDHRPAPGVEIVPFFDPAVPESFGRLPELLAVCGLDWLILEYNPFAWGRRGFCPSIPKTLRRIRLLARRPRIAVMFHETFTREPEIKSMFMRVWQRLFCESTANLSDRNFVSIEAYAEDLSLRKGVLARPLPAGSNLPCPEIGKSEAKRRLGFSPGDLVLGTFGTPHRSRSWEWMEEAVTEVRRFQPNVRFLFVGSGGDEIRGDDNASFLVTTGVVSPEEAARAIRSIDIFLAPFADGYSMRRGSVAAALQQGIPVVSTDGYRTDQVIRNNAGKCFELVRTGDKPGFIEKCIRLAREGSERDRLAVQAQVFFEQNLSWEVIAERMVRGLNATSERTGDNIREPATVL
jgi:glycosyltransferase involved in cell wall biosynthesis